MPAFWLPVRVYLEDTDAQGVIYNASYFRFMERARTDWLRDRGIDHRAVDETLGLALVLTSIEARFVAPGRLGDMLAVSAELEAVAGARAVFAQEVRRDTSAGQRLAAAKAEVACVDVASGRARRWPKGLFEEMNR
jgi:tol-pal system-associated acyl-CoA thioesterase